MKKVKGRTCRSKARAWAVVVGAGEGVRLGGRGPKLLVDLGDEPLVLHSLRVFESCREVGGVVLVVPPGLEKKVRRAVFERLGLTKVKAVVAGGRTRAQSVRAGLAALPGEVPFVLVHDAARPFVTEAIVRSVLRGARKQGAAIPGIDPADTLKRVEEGMAVATLDRSRIRRIQTPQGFQVDLLREAHERAAAEGVEATDDAGLVERLGTRVSVVEGSVLNFKITTREDLEIAGAIVKKAKERKGERAEGRRGKATRRRKSRSA